MPEDIRPLPPTVPKTIQSQVNTILDGLDKDKKIAVVLLADNKGAKAAAFYKIYDGEKSDFSFMGYIDKPYHHDLEFGAKLLWSME